MEELRLEPFTFVGYQRAQPGQPGKLSHASSCVDFVTPNGAHVLLHPSPIFHYQQSPAPNLSPEPHQQPSVPPRPPAGTVSGGAKKPFPPPPSSSALSADTLTAVSRAGKSERGAGVATPSTTQESDALLRVLTTTSAPPDSFQVQFVLSSSSSSASASSAASPSASAPPSRPMTPPSRKCKAKGSNDESTTHEQGEGSVELQKGKVGNNNTVTQIGAMSFKKGGTETDLESMNSSDAVLPPHYEHGLELTLRDEWQTQINYVLTQCALKLFNGRLPQQQGGDTHSNSNTSSDTGNINQQNQQLWSEAVHYQRVVLMGYDNTGVACLMAVPFVQPVPPPQHWRLCPLPLLMCHITQLTKLYTEALEEVNGEENKIVHHRYPVMPRTSLDSIAGSVLGSRTASFPPSTINSPPRGLSMQQPPPPGLRPPIAASAAAADAGSPPPPSLSAGVYLSPPLRWDFAATSHIQALEAAQLFQVIPNKVYQLTRPREEVVFVGVACGVPWVREVVRVATPAGVNAGRGSALQHTHAPLVASATTQVQAEPAALLPPPPPGYRWKDSRGYVVPLVCCHDARDLRGRHGLVDEPAATAAAAGRVTGDSLETSDHEEHAAGNENGDRSEGSGPQQQPSVSVVFTSLPPSRTATSPPHLPSPTPSGSMQGVVSVHSHDNGQTQRGETQPLVATVGPSPLSPPLSTHAATAVNAAPSAPLFVKEGAVVFVPGRFGVMLECVAKPLVLETQFGVVHGDRLLPRAAAASLSARNSPSLLSSEGNRLKSRETTTTAVTVMGVYNRNVLVVLADGASQATQITIRRGVTEMVELFRKIAGTPLPPPALPLEVPSPTLPSLSFEASAPPTHSQEDEHHYSNSEEKDVAKAAEVSGEGHTETTPMEKEGVDEAPTHQGSSTIFVGMHELSVHPNEKKTRENTSNNTFASTVGTAAPLPVSHEVTGARSTTPEAAEGDPDKASPLITHADMEGEDMEEVMMSAAPPANAQDAPMFASRRRTPTPLSLKDVPVPPSSLPPPPPAQPQQQQQQQADRGDPQNHEIKESGVDEGGKRKEEDAVQVAVGEVGTVPAARPIPLPSTAAEPRDTREDETEEVIGESNNETVPSPPALLLSPAKEVASAFASLTSTTAVPPVEEPLTTVHSTEFPQKEVEVDDVTEDGGVGEVILIDDSAAHLYSGPAGLHDSAPTEANPSASETAAGEPDVSPLPALPPPSLVQLPPLRQIPVLDSFLPATCTEDAQEGTGSGLVLSSDHTPSVLPTPSASLARRLQSERRSEDEHASQNDVHCAVDTTNKQTQRSHAGSGGVDTSVNERLQALYLPLSSGVQQNGTVHQQQQQRSHPGFYIAQQEPTDNSEKLDTAATVTTAHGASVARSSESPAAVMPESYYAELSAAAAEPLHWQGLSGFDGAARHAQHLAPPPPTSNAFATQPASQSMTALYQEAFTPSYSPPAAPADGHVAPRYYDSHNLLAGDVGSCYPSEVSMANPRPFSTTMTTTTSATVTSTPFTNFLKAYAAYALQQTAKTKTSGLAVTVFPGQGNSSSSGGTPLPLPLPGLPLILDFYRAQPLNRIVAATESQRRCRAVWSNVGDAAVQNFKRNASTTVLDELCVDELVALLSLCNVTWS